MEQIIITTLELLRFGNLPSPIDKSHRLYDCLLLYTAVHKPLYKCTGELVPILTPTTAVVRV